MAGPSISEQELHYKLGIIEASLANLNDSMRNQFNNLENKIDSSVKRTEAEISKLELKLGMTDDKLEKLENTFTNYRVKASIGLGIIVIIWAVLGDAIKNVLGI